MKQKIFFLVLFIGFVGIIGCGKDEDSSASVSTSSASCGTDTSVPTSYSKGASTTSTTTTTGKYKIVDTHQTKCYDSSTGAEKTCSGTGYDADYSDNQPSYTDNSDQTITDNQTGLMWTKTPDLNGDSAAKQNMGITGLLLLMWLCNPIPQPQTAKRERMFPLAALWDM